MGKHEKLLQQVVGGGADANIGFDDLRGLLSRLGWSERIRGSHHIFSKAGVLDKINLRKDGANAKPYQVKQVRGLILNTGGLWVREARSTRRIEMLYEIVLAWSEEDGAFVAQVPDLPGCAAHGATYEEALAQIKAAAALWLDVAREEGQGIPRPTRRLLAA